MTEASFIFEHPVMIQADSRHPKSSALRFTLALLCLSPCCQSVEKEIAPPNTIPEGFSDSGPKPSPPQWWLTFEDPSLDALIQRALRDNYSLRATWDRLAQAEAVRKREGARLLPTLDVFSDLTRSVSRIDPNGREYATDLSLGARATYEVDLWGELAALEEASSWDVAFSEGQVQTAAVTLSATTATLWFQWITQKGQFALLEEQIETNSRVLELVTLRFHQGQSTAADVLRQRQLVEARRGERTQVLATVRILEHLISTVIGLPPEDPVLETIFEDAPSLPTLPPLPNTGLPSALLQRRPDVRAAYHQVAAADMRLAASIANQYPRLSLDASVTTFGEEPSDLFDDWLANLAANLFAPILDGGSRRAEVDRQHAIVSQRVNEYGQTVLEALAEVEDALVIERQQHRFLESLARQLTLAGDAVDRIRDQYVNGASDFLDVLAALLTFQELQRTQLRARGDLLANRIDLHRALAGNLPIDRPPLARSFVDVERQDSVEGTP